LGFVGIGLIPSLIIELGIFPFMPFLDVPYIEFDKVFGIDTSNLFKTK